MSGRMRRAGIKVPATASEREALDAAWRMLSSGVERVGAEFSEPDDDWEPVYLVLTSTQGTILTPDRGPGRPHKHDMTEMVGAFARRVGAVAIGSVQSSWLVTQDAGKEAVERMMRTGSSEGIEARTEQVMVQLFSASVYRIKMAAIIRHDGAPPTLGPWTTFADSDDPKDWHLEGAMVDPLREAVWRIG